MVTYQKRRKDVDFAAGFFVLWMINVHLGDWNWCTKSDWAGMEYVPFMAWFFYKAGMFYTEGNESSAIQQAKKLLVPFVSFSLIGHLLYCIRLWVEFQDRNLTDYLIAPLASILLRGAANGNFALWFLPSLFIVKFFFPYIYKKSSNIWIWTGVAVLIAFLVSFVNELGWLPKLPGKECVTLPIWMANIPLGFFFYALGFKLKDEQYKSTLVVISIAVVSISVVLPHASFTFRTMQGDGCFLQWLIVSLAAIILLNNIFRRLPWQWNLLQNVGRNAMIWYVWHWPMLTLSRLLFFSMLGIPEGWTLRILQTLFIVVVVSCIVKYQKSVANKYS